jgi:hypothetical protein
VRVLPVGLANELIRESTVYRVGLLDMHRGDLVQLVVITAAYFGAGVIVFRRFERVGRERGLIGAH